MTERSVGAQARRPRSVSRARRPWSERGSLGPSGTAASCERPRPSC